MSSFLALAVVDPTFRKALAKMPPPKDKAISTASLDELLTSTADVVMDRLASGILGHSRDPNMRAAIDRLAGVLGRIEKDDRTLIERKAHGLLSQADSTVSGYLAKAGEWLWTRGDGKFSVERTNWKTQTRSYLNNAALVTAGLISEAHGKSVASALVDAGNKTKV